MLVLKCIGSGVHNIHGYGCIETRSAVLLFILVIKMAKLLRLHVGKKGGGGDRLQLKMKMKE